MTISKAVHEIAAIGCITVAESDGGHLFITATPTEPSSIEQNGSLFNAVLTQLAERGAVPVHERIFGSLDAAPSIRNAFNRAYADAHLTAQGRHTFIQGMPPGGTGFAGLLIHAILPERSFTAPVSVFDGDRIVGRQWRSNRCEYMVLHDLGSEADPNTTVDRQTESVLSRANRLVEGAGFEFRDVARSWFYLENILKWYDTFNRVRSTAYDAFGIMPKPGGGPLLLPASTGIEGRNPARTALTVDLFLVRPDKGAAPPERILNPAQKEAFRYGSSFSRAVCVREAGEALIEISGTAAIDETGRSLYPNDAASQIDCTLDKLEILLSAANAALTDIVSAVVFVKQPETAGRFAAAAARRGLSNFPAVVTTADVCRDDLLFEIDAEALAAQK